MTSTGQERVVDIRFWEQADEFVRENRIEIDRPRGSAHPRQSHIIYPVDYGHLVNTSGGDGEWADIWRGSSETAAVVACAATVDLFQRDTEVKLLYACTADEIDLVEAFYRRHGLGALMVQR